MRELLNQSALLKAISSLNGWEIATDNKSIAKSYKFKDFVSVMKYLNKVAIVAEEMDHHPSWSNSYNRLDVELTTHSIGGITQLDIELAKAMDALV